MKHLLFIILLYFSSSILPQTSNWTTVKETNINVANALSAGGFVDIFTNRYGNHITVQESNNLKYYKMNINGVAESPITIENSAVVTPSISGDADKIRIVYAMGNQIRIQRSTDGTSWTLQTLTLDNDISYIESVMSNGTLHVTYRKSNQIWYRYNSVGIIWSNEINVSEGGTGNVPRITAYKNEQVDFVYFMYRKFNSVDYDCKWRRYDFTIRTWDSPLYTAPIQNDFIDVFGGFRVDNSNVVIYYRWHQNEPWYQTYFRWVILDLNNNWIDYGFADVNNNNNDRQYSTPTADGKTHTAFYFVQLGEGEDSDIGIWRSYMAEDRPTDLIYDYGYILPEEVNYINLSSASNEVHVIWKDDYGNNNGSNLRYKYDDQIPLAPQNLDVTSHREGNKTYPKLTWTLNNEPDVKINEDAYLIERRTKPYGGSWSAWTQIAAVAGTTSSYIDYDLVYVGADAYIAEYRMRAKDAANHISSYSSTVSITFGKFAKTGSEFVNYKYLIKQNNPNPFNPSTTINYSLAKDAFVILKVYDILGNEIGTLINEEKPAGHYTVEFDASNLSSGIYIYRITAMNGERIEFTDTKRMLLMK